MEDKVVELLKEKNLTISFAESCTGGLLAGTLVNVSGSSVVFHESVVTYSNEAKMKYLNVQKETLDQHGAVSRETAKEMSRGIQELSKADIGVSITGIAGPSGGTIEKPVGLVYIGITYRNTYVFEHQFKGDRLKVRQLSVLNALNHILEVVR